MPEELDRCVQEVIAQGHTESEAFAICQAAQKTARSPQELRLKALGLALAKVSMKEKKLPYEMMSTLLWTALDDLYWETGADYWLQATYDDHVIVFNPQSGLYSMPYKQSKEGKITFGDPTPCDVEYPTLAKSKVFVKKTKNGVRWMAISADTEVDLAGERFSEEALQYAVDFASTNQAYGELRLEHHPASRVGYCDGQLVYGGKLIETGYFDDTPRARNFIRTLLADTEGKYKVSVGFLYNPEKLVDGVYTDEAIIFERSATDHPCNVRTELGVSLPDLGEKFMTDQMSYQKLVEMVGKDEAQKIIDAGGSGGVKVDNAGFKESDVEKQGQKAQEDGEDTQSATPESAVSEGENSEGIAEEIEFEFQGRTYRGYLADPTETFKSEIESLKAANAELTASIETLKKQAADKDFVPRVVKYRATNPTPVVEGKVVPGVAQKAALDEFWGGFPGGDSTQVNMKPEVAG